MCGICGVVPADPRRVPGGEDLDAMVGRLGHRGPDGRGTVLLPGAALGHARLAILDLSEAGRQPMANEDGTVWVVLNGEIYNYLELRADLESRGHVFRSRSDTEVLVHLYEEKGAELLHDLRGMFAFALWDAGARTLLLARDRLGKKPLAWHAAPGELLFASELAALATHPGVDRRPDREALQHYLAFQYVPSPWTAFEGVRRLGAGELLQWREGSPEVRRWWRPRPLLRSARSVPEAEERLGALLDEAVRLRLRSDVPVGAFLSGGVDSSLVVALMASHGPVRTFSVGFAEEGWNELPGAREVARLLGTEHHELVVRPDAARVLPRLVRHFGEPFADAAALPTYYLAEHASAHVKVVLTGDGGDEAFAGYDRYRAARLERALRRVPGLAPGLCRLGGLFPESRGRRFLESLARREGTPRLLSFFDEDDLAALYSDEMRGRFPPLRGAGDPMARGGGVGALAGPDGPGRRCLLPAGLPARQGRYRLDGLFPGTPLPSAGPPGGGVRPGPASGDAPAGPGIQVAAPPGGSGTAPAQRAAAPQAGLRTPPAPLVPGGPAPPAGGPGLEPPGPAARLLPAGGTATAGGRARGGPAGPRQQAVGSPGAHLPLPPQRWRGRAARGPVRPLPARVRLGACGGGRGAGDGDWRVLGALLGSRTRWVADYRDTWTTNPLYRRISPVHERIDRGLEGHLHRRADAILTTTPGFRRDLLAAFPGLAPRKVHTIPNGYDTADSVPPSAEPSPDGRRVLALVVGNRYRPEVLEPLLGALQDLRESHPESAARLRIRVLGGALPGVQGRLLRETGLVEEVPYRPHAELYREIAAADAGLVVVPPGRGSDHWVPQKVYLYLHCRRPVLALGPEGDLGSLLRALDAGRMASPERPVEAAALLDRWVRDPSVLGPGTPGGELFAALERRALTGRLAAVLEGRAPAPLEDLWS